MADRSDWHVLVRLRDGSTQTWGPAGAPYLTGQPDVREWLVLPMHRPYWGVQPWDIVALTVIGTPPPDVAVMVSTVVGDYELHEFPVSEFVEWVYAAHMEGRS